MTDPLMLTRTNDEDKEFVELQRTDPNTFLIYLSFIEFLANPASDTSHAGIREFSEKTGVDAQVLHGWKRSRTLQYEVANRAREHLYTGESIAEVYRKLMAMVSDPTVDEKVKAQLLMKMASLDLKRLDILAKLQIAKDRKRQSSEKAIRPIEEIVEEQNARPTTDTD